MRAFEDKVTKLPAVITISPLAHPPSMISLADLFQDALPGFELTNSAFTFW